MKRSDELRAEREPERPAAKILRGLSEAAAWSHGEGKALVHIPGQSPRMMTRAEFEAALLAREEADHGR